MTEMTLTKIDEIAPDFAKVAESIASKSPFQKKAVARRMSQVDETFINFAQNFITRFLKGIDQPDGHDYLAQAYLDYTKSIRIEEMYFAKEGKYRYENFNEVNELVYSRSNVMTDYVAGLGMTQIFWPNHYEIVRFYLDEFIPLIKDAKAGAEVGVGHGLFHTEMLLGAPSMHSTMLDISKVSLATTHKMIEAAGMDKSRAKATHCNIQDGIPLDDESLDVLLMGELIEHIQNGEEVLTNFTTKMKRDGLCFFTTAANAPAEDHILLFRNIGEIHKILDRSGWTVKKEHIGTLNGMSREEAEKDGHNINYAAIICKKLN